MLVPVSKRGNDELGKEEEGEKGDRKDVGNEAGRWETLERRGETKKRRKRKKKRKKVAEARGDVSWSGLGRGMESPSRGNVESPRRVEKTRTRM